MSWTRLASQYAWPDIEDGVRRTAPTFFREADMGAFTRMLERTIGRRNYPVLEIGSWAGDSARWLLASNEEIRLVCVDTWLGNHELVGHREWTQDLFDQFLLNLVNHHDRCIAVRLDSVSGIYAAGQELSNIRFCYLDGGHTEEQVSADIMALRRHWPGSPILGDDWERPDVKRGVLAVLDAYDVDSAGNKWWTVR